MNKALVHPPILLTDIQAMVRLCEEQAVMASMFYETWTPTVNDTSLAARMGTSFATQSFNIIAWALRREIILALMRLWDTRSDSTNLTRIRDWISHDENYEILLKERAGRLPGEPDEVIEILRESFEPSRKHVLDGIGKYMEGGEKRNTFKCLLTVRRKRLAHRDLQTPPDAVDPTNEQLSQFYLDTLSVVTALLHLFNAKAFDLESQATEVYRHHARFFWAGVCGERTEGHPDFLVTPP